MDGLNNAFYTDKTPPLIKNAPFSFLTEQEVAKMRTFISILDTRIQPGEVFFYAPNSMNRNIEGDDYPTLRKVSTIAGAYKGAGRRKVERLNADGSSSPVVEQIRVMWCNGTVSPAAFTQVAIDLK